MICLDVLVAADTTLHAARAKLLAWAARLAEVGLSIAHAQYHKHSAYVLSNADMPGFSRVEQQRLARIVLAHRGKLEKMEAGGVDNGDWNLVFALRLASTLLRRRTRVRLPAFRVLAGDESLPAARAPRPISRSSWS